MPTTKDDTLPIQSSQDVVAARQLVRTRTIELGFTLIEQTKIVTAASELARNTLEHGKGGSCRIECVIDGLRKGIRLTFEDRGPGIADVSLALTDGYTTGHGMGLGLSGSRRLMTDFELVTNVGQGTRVTVAKWK